MKTRLLSTVAASLLIGIGAAAAQAPGHQATPERTPAAQQSAPAEKVAPPMNTRERKGPETTGQGAAAGQAKLSTEQRTKITTVIRSQKIERVEPSQLNVAINVGMRIPGSVRVHRLPQEVVTIYPEWRGYDYILVRDQIVIIDPHTHEIVFIIEA